MCPKIKSGLYKAKSSACSNIAQGGGNNLQHAVWPFIMDTEKINHMKSEKSDIFSPVLQSQIGELFLMENS